MSAAHAFLEPVSDLTVLPPSEPGTWTAVFKAYVRPEDQTGRDVLLAVESERNDDWPRRKAWRVTPHLGRRRHERHSAVRSPCAGQD